MFFVRYLGCELRRRMRQAVVIALGLALGIGLVITVTAASAGVRNAQAAVLRTLYGQGTDITVSETPQAGGEAKPVQRSIQIGPSGSKVCTNGKCVSGAQSIDSLVSASYGPIAYSSVAAISKLHHVSAVAGGLTLNDNQITVPAAAGPNVKITAPTSFSVQGVDLSRANLGPLSAGTIASGHTFTTADAHSDVALVDADYASSRKLKVGSKVTVGGTKFTVIGVVKQPEASSPPQVYIPLARAQALGTDGPGGRKLTGDVTTIYVTAASAADIAAVQHEIEHLLPTATVTTAASLANQITGSAATAAKLADDLGKWLAIVVLVAAFALASLLTMGAVSRRAREFGTLKALGWRSSRIVGQMMGESVSTGLIGGLAGIGLGLGGIAIINAIAPKLTAMVANATDQHFFGIGPNGSASSSPTADHAISVPWSASVTVDAIALAVALAILGGLIAGALGSWRISRLRPAAALARVD
jgi:putative ABC transport system permease protein